MSRPPKDLAEAQALVRKVAEAHPERVNPQDYFNVCLYTDPETGLHCIAGTIFIEELGIDPAVIPEEATAAEVLRKIFPGEYGFEPEDFKAWPARSDGVYDSNPVLNFFVKIQQIADGAAMDDLKGENARPWGEVLQLAETFGWMK